MALVKAPAGGIAASGKIGGTVYARNRAGQYARGWAKPVNPGTVRQAAVRSQFGTSSAHWSMLTSAQHNAWDAYAALLTRLNKLGEAYTPKGRQIYMEVNNNLQQALETMLTAPTAFQDNPAVTGLDTLTVDSTAGVLTAMGLVAYTDVVPSGGNGTLLIEASPPHSSKITNVNNQFRQIFVAQTGSDPYDLLAAYIAVFGSAVPIGSIVSFRTRVIDVVSGLGSSYFYADVVAT